MKIRKITPETSEKSIGLLRAAFPGSSYEANLVENLRRRERVIHEWVCLHINSAIAYIAFTNAYNGDAVCGLHLAPLAVKPQFQRQGVGSELLRFALTQPIIMESAIFVLGDPGFYQRFGFTPCATPICPFDTNNAHFLSIRNAQDIPFTVGYEPEFAVPAAAREQGKQRRQLPARGRGRRR